MINPLRSPLNARTLPGRRAAIIKMTSIVEMTSYIFYIVDRSIF